MSAPATHRRHRPDSPGGASLYVTRNASSPGNPLLGAGGLHSNGWGTVDKTMAVDFDGDGKDDILGRNGDQLFMWRNTSSATDWSIGPFQVLSAGNSTVSSYLMGDFDGNGIPDIGAYSADRNSLYVTRNVSTPGNPAVGAGGLYSSGWSGVNLTMTLDWDGDGKDDILGRSGDGFFLWRSTSTGTSFSFVGPLAISSAGNSTVSSYLMGDFDGNGKPDIGAFSADHGSFYITRNTRHRALFRSVEVASTGCWVKRDLCLTTDWDGDGKDDILCRSGDSLLLFRSTILQRRGRSP